MADITRKSLGLNAAGNFALISFLLISTPFSAQADQVILDDLIVDGSACIGMDCANGESFGFDTIRLKENNLRIRAVDTSSSASFPTRDWQITFNDSSNGGANKFSIDDIDGGRTPFTLEAGAPSHSLYVDDGGRVGFGTSTPVVDLHVKSGNTPTLRLEQDASSGFTAQTWDVAGNEANFFVRDATNGSTLPFRIYPNAPSNALVIEGSTGFVGIGTTNPADYARLHVANSGIVLNLTESTDDGAVQIRIKSDSTNRRFLAIDGSDVVKSQIIFGDEEIKLAGETDRADDLFLTANAAGLLVHGTISTDGSGQVHPDYVFKDDYELMPLSELRSFIIKNRHLPEVPSAEDVSKNGLNMTEMQVTLLKKVEELTLYTLKQQEIIDQLQAKLSKRY